MATGIVVCDEADLGFTVRLEVDEGELDSSLSAQHKFQIRCPFCDDIHTTLVVWLDEPTQS
jgi:hypothetical protein